jgi:hypothetical protein
LKILKGEKTLINNIIVAIRLLSVFYIVGTLLGSILYKAAGNNVYILGIGCIIAYGFLQVICFAAVLIGLNQLNGRIVSVTLHEGWLPILKNILQHSANRVLTG